MHFIVCQTALLSIECSLLLMDQMYLWQIDTNLAKETMPNLTVKKWKIMLSFLEHEG